jgi:hypothetical protein
MSRKRSGTRVRGQAPKGRPTPKNTPGSRSRRRHAELEAHREEILKRLGMDRVLDTIRRGDRGEKEALELLTRESGGVILNPKEER